MSGESSKAENSITETIMNREVESNPRTTRQATFQLNKQRTLDKKIKACNNTQKLTITMENGNNLRILCSTTTFEQIRNLIDNAIQASGYNIEKVEDEDQDGQIFRDTIKVKEKESRRNRAIYTINMYRTTSSMVVNGPQVQKFVQETIPVIQSWAQENEEVINMGDKYLEKMLKRLKMGQPVEMKTSDKAIENNQTPNKENIETQEKEDSEQEKYDFMIDHQEKVTNDEKTQGNKIEGSNTDKQDDNKIEAEGEEENKKKDNAQKNERNEQLKSNQESEGTLGENTIMVYNDKKRETTMQEIETEKVKQKQREKTITENEVCIRRKQECEEENKKKDSAQKNERNEQLKSNQESEGTLGGNTIMINNGKKRETTIQEMETGKVKQKQRKQTIKENEICNVCYQYVTTGVECGICKRWYHFQCEETTEEEITKIYPEEMNYICRKDKMTEQTEKQNTEQERKKIEEEEAGNENLRATLEKVKEEKLELERKNKEISEEHTKTKNELEEIIKQKHQCNKQREQKELEITKLQQEKRTLEELVKSFRNFNRIKITQVPDKEQTINNLKAQLQKEIGQGKILVKDNVEMKARISRQENEIKQRLTEEVNRKRELQETKEQLDKIKKEQQQHIKNSKIENEKSSKTIHKLEKEIETLDKQIQDLKTVNIHLETKMNDQNRTNHMKDQTEVKKKLIKGNVMRVNQKNTT